MQTDLYFADKYVEISASHMIVNYNGRTEMIDLPDISSARLSAENNRREWLETKSLLIAALLGPLVAWAIRWQHSLVWTLTLQTTSGPVDILTSNDGIYLSKVKRALIRALKDTQQQLGEPTRRI